MLREIKDLFNQPYPDSDEIGDNIRSALIAGSVVSLILYAFMPFGMHHIPQGAWKYCLLFGFITVIVAISYDLISYYVFQIKKNHPSWTFIKWLFYVIGLLVFISIANYAASVMLFDQEATFVYPQVLVRTLIVGIFPTAIFGSIKVIRQLRANQQIAEGAIIPRTKKSKASTVDIPIKDSKQTYAIEADHILYAEAQQNYVMMVYLSNGKIKKEMIRNTITAIENSLQETSVIRCHRSFLVNPLYINKVTGNAQGLKLQLDHFPVDAVIPVSRKYISLFR